MAESFAGLCLVVAVVFTLLNAVEKAPLWPAVLALIAMSMVR